MHHSLQTFIFKTKSHIMKNEALTPANSAVIQSHADTFINAAHAFGGLTAEVVEDLQDGRVTTLEFLGLVDNVQPVVTGVKEVIANRRALRYLSESEREQVYLAVADEFKTSSAGARAIVDQITGTAADIDKVQGIVRKRAKSFADTLAAIKAGTFKTPETV